MGYQPEQRFVRTTNLTGTPRALSRRPILRTKRGDRVGTPVLWRLLAVAVLVAATLGGAQGAARACVGRTISVGYLDVPDQVLLANLLLVFIDERTGTTVKLARFETREAAFEALRQDKISLYADYSRILLAKFGGETPGPDEETNLSRLKEALNRRHNVVWLEQFGYDRNFSGKNGGKEPGRAGLMLCKDALGKFPALPRLLAKLRGILDNDTMAALLRETEGSDPKTVARRFLKARKLV